jgi:hypothetical protein
VPAYGALGVVPIMLVTCYAKSFWTSLTFYLLHFLLAEVRREGWLPSPLYRLRSLLHWIDTPKKRLSSDEIIVSDVK